MKRFNLVYSADNPDQADLLLWNDRITWLAKTIGDDGRLWYWGCNGVKSDVLPPGFSSVSSDILTPTDAVGKGLTEEQAAKATVDVLHCVFGAKYPEIFEAIAASLAESTAELAS